MVSTRGVRYKFSEGERVLCYEPDPTKAKVLYDSKVLEVIESKDKRGRRTVEYLIHFQGWNSSWDRCVSEDFVLKDTKENRQLQRDLAERSQLQLGAYLYRRERKKGGSTSAAGTGPGPAKRPRHGFSDDGSSSSTQPDYNTEDDGRRPHTPEEDSSRSDESARAPSPPIVFVGRAVITLPSALRDRLTFDYHLVVKRGRLSQLPATPCVAQILESFVKWYARAGAWHSTYARTDPEHMPNLLDVSCRLNLVREVADGMRVYFDFILRNHLLYKQELTQYHEICGQFIDKHEACKKRELEGAEEYDDEPMGTEEEVVAVADEDLKSPKIPDYSHLPPDPMDADKSEGESNNQDDGIASKSDSNDKTAAISDSTTDDNQVGGSGKTRESRPATRSGSVGRRLRSHKSAVSQSENEEPTPSTSTGEPRHFEMFSSSVGSSGSSLSECWARPATAAPVLAPRRTPLSQLLDKVAKWQIIPREGTEHLPCRVYGAIHLCRLFVKLPDFLNALPQMSIFKLKLVLRHVDMFIHYLEQHGEWFGEIYYVADTTSRSR